VKLTIRTAARRGSRSHHNIVAHRCDTWLHCRSTTCPGARTRGRPTVSYGGAYEPL